jgi:transmembrane sensor
MIEGDHDEGTAGLKRDARRLFAELVSGDATPADFEAAARWRRQSPAHEAAFTEATRLWQDIGPATRALIMEQGPLVWPPRQTSRRAILGGAVGAFAAATAVYAAVDPPLGLWPSFEELRADYRTATGEQRVLTLADDVSVQMNTQTSIAVAAANTNTDQLTLIAGEASFAMPSKSAKSLAVVAEAGRTTAAQARFDISNIGDSVCVTCFDGEIRVEQGAQVATVGASRQLRYDRYGLGETVTINPTEASAWQNGILIFRDAPLSYVVTEINRYRQGRVILLNAALGRKDVNGRFKIQRIDEVLAWIEEVLGAKSRSLPGGIVLLS